MDNLDRYIALQKLITEREAVLVEVEMMKAANTARESEGYSLAYDEVVFGECIKQLENIHGRMSAI